MPENENFEHQAPQERERKEFKTGDRVLFLFLRGLEPLMALFPVLVPEIRKLTISYLMSH